MKPSTLQHLTPAARPVRRRERRGFALIVTLSLMILLTIIAVGLLTLSSISLRAASQADAMATARANARMALMLALGELQKNAGPDQRVTARADILDADPSKIKNPRLTGVWKSWDIKATAPPSATEYDKTARDGKFVGWLASSVDGKAATQINFAKDTVLTTTGNPATAVALWDKGSLGTAATKSDIVLAPKVPTSPSRGALAWAVMDEGVKVRINTPYVDGATTKGMQTAQLGSGERPNTAEIPGSSDPKDPKYNTRPLADLGRPLFLQGSSEFTALEKGITRLNFGLAAESLAKGTDAALKPLTHDVTSSSVGLFTDTAIGGLKEDFNLLTNSANLPSTYSGKGIYVSRLAMNASDAPSDPRWESLKQYARIYNDNSRITLSGGVPVLKAQGPATTWKASTGSDPASGKPGTINLAPPPGVVLMPAIAKVQLVFSLMTRDVYNYPKVNDTTPKVAGTKAEETTATIHKPWGTNFAGSSYDYLLHLLYTPVVTLHNPYNVALEFTDLKVLFGNVPFGLQVFRNGVQQTTAPAPLDTMYYRGSETGSIPKRFGMTLKTNGGTPTSPTVGSFTFRLLPGEVMMFSPYINPNLRWVDEETGARIFSDWDTGDGTSTRTLAIDGIPGWRGDGIGFDLDWFCPSYNGLRVSTSEVDTVDGKPNISMDRGGCIAAKATDEFSLKFAPLSVPALSNNKFTVEIFARPPGSGTQISSSVIEMDYETPTGLQEALLGKDGAITFPKTGTINAMAMHSHSTTRIKDIATAKPFAIISAQTKATQGGMLPDGEDGKLATKPWSFGHEVIGASTQKMVSDGMASGAHEFAFQRLDNGTTNLLQFDPKTGRGNAITGQTGNTGLKFGAMYDIPLSPLQTLASLNGANPGGSSGYLPRFAQPIGNSWAHPMLDPSMPVSPGKLLDHSFLLNLALYDHFYFSGLADQNGSFGTGKNASSLATSFSTGTSLVDPRLALYAPDGKAESTFPTEVAAADAYARVASWQVMNGAFNINSTSVGAWKAMLGSIHDSQAIINKLNKPAKSSAIGALVSPATGATHISRFRMPVESDDPDENYWLGAREYSDAELQLLAEKIVEQVRARGPFLSMSEFVNRRLGPASDEKAQRGALQQAIDNTNLNRSFAGSKAGYDIPESALTSYKYNNTKAGSGPSYQGAPGYLTQADLLNVLGNAATPRSDTFTIRGYGEARDSANRPTATATCEAVIQRVPEYIDPADKAETAPAVLSSNANKTFGRRFKIVSFRWLAANEV